LELSRGQRGTQGKVKTRTQGDSQIKGLRDLWKKRGVGWEGRGGGERGITMKPLENFMAYREGGFWVVANPDIGSQRETGKREAPAHLHVRREESCGKNGRISEPWGGRGRALEGSS